MVIKYIKLSTFSFVSLLTCGRNRERLGCSGTNCDSMTPLSLHADIKGTTAAVRKLWLFNSSRQEWEEERTVTGGKLKNRTPVLAFSQSVAAR